MSTAHHSHIYISLVLERIKTKNSCLIKAVCWHPGIEMSKQITCFQTKWVFLCFILLTSIFFLSFFFFLMFIIFSVFLLFCNLLSFNLSIYLSLFCLSFFFVIAFYSFFVLFYNFVPATILLPSFLSLNLSFSFSFLQ